jgi:hypothetical protein
MSKLKSQVVDRFNQSKDNRYAVDVSDIVGVIVEDEDLVQALADAISTSIAYVGEAFELQVD